MKKLDLHHWIFVAMGVGLVAGLILNTTFSPDSEIFKETVWWLNLFGKDIFINSLKMIIAPLIFVSIIAGISSLPSMKELGNIGTKTFGYYFATTTVAVTIGLGAVLIIQPGHKEASQKVRDVRENQLKEYRNEYKNMIGGGNPTSDYNIKGYLQFIETKEGNTIKESHSKKWGRMNKARERDPGDMFREDILLPILSNPIDALASTRSLGIIFFALLVGMACLALGKTAEPVMKFFASMNEVMMTITLWVMKISPVAIGCLIASMVATLGMDALRSLGWYCITVIVGIALHCCFLLFLVSIFSKTSPIAFIKGIRNAWLIAFSTTSSAATLPVTMKCLHQNLKVSPKVSNFALPVGATVNMDGTALYEGIAVIFLIQMYGGLDDVPIVLTAMKTFIIFITAVLASIGAAAVPSAGLITMAIVAGAVGLPLHYIVIIFAVDRMLDMFRTSTNVMGDAAGAVIVNHLEQKNLGRKKG